MRDSSSSRKVSGGKLVVAIIAALVCLAGIVFGIVSFVNQSSTEETKEDPGLPGSTLEPTDGTKEDPGLPESTFNLDDKIAYGEDFEMHVKSFGCNKSVDASSLEYYQRCAVTVVLEKTNPEASFPDDCVFALRGHLSLVGKEKAYDSFAPFEQREFGEGIPCDWTPYEPSDRESDYADVWVSVSPEDEISEIRIKAPHKVFRILVNGDQDPADEDLPLDDSTLNLGEKFAHSETSEVHVAAFECESRDSRLVCQVTVVLENIGPDTYFPDGCGLHIDPDVSLVGKEHTYGAESRLVEPMTCTQAIVPFPTGATASDEVSFLVQNGDEIQEIRIRGSHKIFRILVE